MATKPQLKPLPSMEEMVARVRRMYPKHPPPAKPISEMTIDEVIAVGRAMQTRTDQWIADNHPLARKGLRFKPGKPKDSQATITKAVSAYLRKHSQANASEVWIALHDRPPKGYTFVDNPRFGKYIEHGATTVMKYRSFQNLVSIKRPAKAKRAYKRT